jgi:hypothetical protein
MDEMLSYLESAYNDGKAHCLHYVTARQMYNIIKAAESGLHGNPGLYREYEQAGPIGVEAECEARGRQ